MPGSAWGPLDHAKHDCANKGEGDIGGKDAQLADESHGKAGIHNHPTLRRVDRSGLARRQRVRSEMVVSFAVLETT